MNEKIVGYSLVSLGILIIGGATVSMYLVFSSRIAPLAVFDLPGISIDAASLIPQTTVLNAPEGFLPRSSAPSAKIEMFPAQMLNTILNTVAHVIFMGFVVSVGFRIASIGTMLARPIVVKVRAAKENNAPNPTNRQNI